jgi:anhydro-N-acetylmuramic acid kinase
VANKIYRVIGIMSGTSLDGIDLAACRFSKVRGKWEYAIQKATTIPYNKYWKSAVSSAHLQSGESLISLNIAYGKYLGEQVRKFIVDQKIGSVDFVASHGHTVFHQPFLGYTFQLGDGAAIHSTSGLPVIYDFRNLDVQFGGQGAPLVPVGDRLLFHEYGVCVNLGGIANLSFEKGGKRLAWDICFVNMALNMLAGEAGKAFDRNGKLASGGQVKMDLLKSLTQAGQSLGKDRPSLAREHFEKAFEGILKNKFWSLKDRLRTMTEFIAREVGTTIRKTGANKILITGGGAHNTFLVDSIRRHAGDEKKFVKADPVLINYKEALIFAFLGVLNISGENNALRSVTGAQKDTCTGACVGFGGQ